LPVVNCNSKSPRRTQRTPRTASASIQNQGVLRGSRKRLKGPDRSRLGQVGGHASGRDCSGRPLGTDASRGCSAFASARCGSVVHVRGVNPTDQTNPFALSSEMVGEGVLGVLCGDLPLLVSQSPMRNSPHVGDSHSGISVVELKGGSLSSASPDPSGRSTRVIWSSGFESRRSSLHDSLSRCALRLAWPSGSTRLDYR